MCLIEVPDGPLTFIGCHAAEVPQRCSGASLGAKFAREVALRDAYSLYRTLNLRPRFRQTHNV